ncbi:hypothetical protein MJH12_16540 [bacterium]|nr:hypothetical protein [bacterium]
MISLNSTVYKGFRRTKPELLEFHDSHFYHCEGIEPLDFFCVKSTNQLSNLSELLKFSQTEVDISIRDVSNFQLSQLPHGSKLSYDIGIKRFEVGKTIGDVEKQIIYKFLLKYYSL